MDKIHPHFKDRREVLFGRAPALAHLLKRADEKGVTAVVALPQMGKTWLLHELARVLSEERGHLVGYYQSHGEGSDLLLRAVSNLYTRWLSNTSLLKQATTVWRQQKGELLAKFATAFGGLLSDIGLAAPVSKHVETFLQGLVTANATLRSGGLELKYLQSDQARDLVNLVAQVSKHPVVIILDGWEKSPALDLQANLVDDIARNLECWPLHLYLGVRSGDGVEKRIEAIQTDYSPLVEVYTLPPLDLRDDSEAQRLCAYLQRKIPVTQTVECDRLLDMVAGHAGVIMHWERWSSSLETVPQLRNLANQARKCQYQEFDTLLAGFKSEDARTLAMRLAFVPTTDRSYWDTVKSAVLGDIAEETLDDLRTQGVLETAEPPSYGHDKRWETARGWFSQMRTVGFKKQAETVIYAFAATVRSKEPGMVPYIQTLASLRDHAESAGLSELSQAFCHCAASMLELPGIDAVLLIRAASQTDADTRPLLAMGLFYTFRYENNLKRRDKLLDELRALAVQHPPDGVVGEQLAYGLFNTLIHLRHGDTHTGYSKRRNKLLDELRVLAVQHPHDGKMRELLAWGLLNALLFRKAEDTARRDALINEMLEMAERHPGDTVLASILTLCGE